ncbi:MAG: prepilin-type N-terminal cleavage/methylation domain-containing protein [Thermodesulfobacteriota bacterium]|nr:prepilin-type N-terminal cleavage/methylation domain-containing protein [Thermodesulfobacteriota bacterium]
MSRSAKTKANGFSLIEIIITLVVVSILGTIMYTFLNTGITKSSIPLNLVREDFELESVLEKITDDYRRAVQTNGGSFDLAAFVGTIDSVAKVNTLYGSNVDTVTIVSTAFDAAGQETGSDDNIKKVTIQQGDSIIRVLLTQ